VPVHGAPMAMVAEELAGAHAVWCCGATVARREHARRKTGPWGFLPWQKMFGAVVEMSWRRRGSTTVSFSHGQLASSREERDGTQQCIAREGGAVVASFYWAGALGDGRPAAGSGVPTLTV
jgi:hypothetical protein